MDQFFLTLYNLGQTGYYYNSDNDIFDKRVKEAGELAQLLNRYAKNNGLGLINIERDNHRLQIISSELSFILVFLNFFENCCGKVRDSKRDQYYVLWNSQYAFSNNQELSCYVPHLKRAYKYESVAADDLKEEASHTAIIELIHCTHYQFLELIEDGQIHPSRLWSPFDEDNFFNTSDFKTNQTRKQNFKELLSKRIESKKVYIKELLNSINNAKDFNNPSYIKCSDANGMPVIIDSSKIAAIVPESDSRELITAKIVIPSDTVIHVDLQSYVKDLTGFILNDYHLPKNLVAQPTDNGAIDFKEAKKLAEELIKTIKKEMDEKTKSHETLEDTEFDPDFVPGED